MKALLIEDEPPAMVHLEALVTRADPNVTIVGRATSCREARSWLAEHPAPDLIFSDIQLGDGSALTIFESTTIRSAIVFCTAFDRHVMDALQVGGIDYLLKPITLDDVRRAIDKVRTMVHVAERNTGEMVAKLFERLGGPPKRFVVRRGAEFVAVALDDVAYFRSEHKLTVLVEKSGLTSYLDESLTALERQLQGARFFRTSRASLVSLDAIRSFRPADKGRLALTVVPPSPQSIVVSQENAAAFRAWFEGR